MTTATAQASKPDQQPDPPKGYANWKEYFNAHLTRRQVYREVRTEVLTPYHHQYVEPLETWWNLPLSRRVWELTKAWPRRELVWPPRLPWWVHSLRAWVEGLLEGDDEEGGGS